ncbi:hypothetical protein AVEN_188420-1 [Araneus ventricosus]|uniref:Uncharacterized protein n=1 Tax=Araneus ventricosus TaxID=182803 RepID=A0A4Y2KB20_ARAVE|nr:hypothetical protein AVEN_188420-1 [Araneus ventricosus]
MTPQRAVLAATAPCNLRYATTEGCAGCDRALQSTICHLTFGAVQFVITLSGEYDLRNRTLPNTCDHKKFSLTILDINRRLSLDTVCFHDCKSMSLLVQSCAAIYWRSEELDAEFINTSTY